VLRDDARTSAGVGLSTPSFLPTLFARRTRSHAVTGGTTVAEVGRMSDAPPKPETPAAAGPKVKPSKLILALLVLNLGATGFATFKTLTAKPAQAAKHEVPPPSTSEVGPTLSLDPFVVNLDEAGQSRYLKVTMMLEVSSKDVIVKITKGQQLIRDAILSHLSGLKLADTLGVAAKEKLRNDVIAKIDTILGPGKVRRVFFQEFVVQ
jgi:flagellar protein FliL